MTPIRTVASVITCALLGGVAAPAEKVEKRPEERRKYQHPELYAQPKERGLYFDATRESEDRDDAARMNRRPRN